MLPLAAPFGGAVYAMIGSILSIRVPSLPAPRWSGAITIAAAIFLCGGNNRAAAQTGANLLLVVNAGSAASEAVARHYVTRRVVPQDNICSIHAPTTESITRDVYESQIEPTTWKCIPRTPAPDPNLNNALQKGIPIRI